MNDPINMARIERRKERLEVATVLLAGRLAGSESGPIDGPTYVAAAVKRADQLIAAIDAPVELKPTGKELSVRNGFELADGWMPMEGTRLEVYTVEVLGILCSPPVSPFTPSPGITAAACATLETVGLATAHKATYMPTWAGMKLMGRG